MERYSKNDHFNFLSNISEMVKPELAAVYNEFFQLPQITKESLTNDLNLILEKRLAGGQNLIRPFLVSVALRISGVERLPSYVNLMLAIEVFNISTYQSNSSFDLKNINTSDDEDYNCQFIMSQFSLNKALSLVHESKNISHAHKLYIIKNLINANNDVYKGQYLEQKTLKSTKLDPEIEYSEYIKLYLERCNLLDGTQFGTAFLMGAYHCNKKTRQVLFDIGMRFGICVQILNDLEDFIPGEKSGNDIRNNLMTLPAFLIQRHYNAVNRQDFSGPPYSACTNILKQWSFLRVIVDQLLYQFDCIKVDKKILEKRNINTEFLDFIFPHIFLSRIIKQFVTNKKQYYDYLKQRQSI